MIALLVALATAALVSLQPWAKDPVSPRVSLAPGFGVALGDAVAVSPGRHFAVSAARPAAGRASFAANEVVEGVGAGRPLPGIAPARVVASSPPAPPAGSPPPPSPEPSPAPQPPPAPVATPVSVPAQSPSPTPIPAPPTRPTPGAGGHPGPGTAGGGGAIGDVVSGPVLVREGDEYAYSFSVYVQPAAYRAPGEENLVLRFGDETSDSFSFGLQLWDDGSGAQRGLWASGEAMGEERFLAPLVEGVWHEVAVAFRASSEDDGIYLLLLDGEPIDARAGVSLIDPASDSALLEAGLFRDGERIDSAPDVLFGPALLSETLEPVIP